MVVQRPSMRDDIQAHMFQTSSLHASRCLVSMQPSTRWRPPQRRASADTSWGNADRHGKLDMG
jgi:hypothetical protein